MEDTWTVATAKARFSELIDRAATVGPQVVTRSGQKTAVVVSAEEWFRKTRRSGTLAEFLAASPLRGSGVTLKRRVDRARKTGV